MAEGDKPTPAPEQRPRPEYGEYAPEGWDWKPEGATDADAAGQPAGASAPQPGTPAQYGSRPAAPAAGAGPVPGVPHNLGAGSALPGKSARAPQQSAGAPYRGNAPQTPQQPQQLQQSAPAAGPQQGGAVPTAKRRPADRVITIVLLAIGAIGALQLAAACFGMATTFALIGDTAGIDPFDGPAWLPTAGKVTGVVIFALYALTLIFSIRRIRAGKLTFWAPLAAGALAFVIVLGLTFATIIGTPELMTAISDPAQAQLIMENLQSMQTLQTQ